MTLKLIPITLLSGGSRHTREGSSRQESINKTVLEKT